MNIQMGCETDFDFKSKRDDENNFLCRNNINKFYLMMQSYIYFCRKVHSSKKKKKKNLPNF